MPDGQSLEFSGVTKRFGAVTAVAGLTARVDPGMVTGFLGPNGAGKTTTLRILLGLVKATDGHATIGGKRYAELDKPLQTVGAVLEASSFHPGRTATAHLTIYAQAAGITKSRVGEVLDLVGLTDAANRKVGGYSLGMRQRLGLAYALLGDPGVLVLDEPANGLDPEGIRWMRGFLRQLASEGRTVLVSSHLLAEVQQTVDALLIISRGRLVFQGGVDELTDPREYATVVDAPDRAALGAALKAAGVPFEVLRSGLTVRGVDPTAVGAAAAAGGVALSALHRRGPALEEVFLDLVNGTRMHPSAAGGVDAAPPAPTVGETASEADEAAESALTAAALDAEATSAPGAATALAAAAGAAWVSEPDEPGADSEPEAPIAPAPVAYAVASTGVIDIVPSAAPEDAEPQPEPASETEPEPASETEPQPDDEPQPEPASETEPEPEPQPEPASEPADPWAPEDADPDVEAIGEIDDELSTPEPPDADDDRPWEHYVKTDSDIEADAFFAAFDHTAAARESELAAARESELAAEAEPEPEPEPEPEAWIPPEAEAFEDAVGHTPPAETAEPEPEPGAEASISSESDPAADAVTAPADGEGGDR
ncbi:ABC-type multidrug transport system ATPase subunit [Microbacterium trichothecenolyticum]|uniref:ATP-binding cassette domain-containing protein n=1 Tax=Microbacterium trichothecenolyticum TaxID=69370 RepID=UPI002855269F|nr:ATP-binding cassette domain-containing protein [Microbacterium trichothecenolyticum]MDR7183766.1 ABC-type multidrug transport system ATPase subunit [Microbacterium trichothecenolyticum]